MQKNYGIRFLSLSGSVPSKIVRNSDLEKLFNTTDEWIFSRTGIKERRVVSENESGLSLSADAARKAIKDANINPEDIDLIIVSTATPDKLYPSMACQLQGIIGAKNAVCFDISAACSGFVFGIATAAQFIYTGQYKNILLVGVDIHSRFVDWSERSVAILFGDGAGAVLMSSGLAKDDELGGFVIHSASDKNYDLVLDNSNVFYSSFKKESNPNFVSMNGKAIYQFAVTSVPAVINEVLDKLTLTINDIDYFVLHQANQRIIDAVGEKLKIDKSKMLSNISNVGNTSAASIPLAICDYMNAKKLKFPARFLLVGFGAGLTWGAAVVNFNFQK